VAKSINERADAYLRSQTQASAVPLPPVTEEETLDLEPTPERTELGTPSSSVTPTASGPSISSQEPTLASSQGESQARTSNMVNAAFKIPRAWDHNSPRFTSEDPDDLADFVDQVGEIISLAGIETDAEKKKLLTGYLPLRKRKLWRDHDNYANLSYDDFLKEVYKRYPELKEDEVGTVDDLEKLCRRYQGIRLQDEGKLKRFGAEFSALYKKLSKHPAVILNKEACLKYLETLDSSFASLLRTSISSRNLFKADINRAAGVQPPVAGVDAVDHRKEDPILLKDLLEMAEQLSATGVAGATWDGYGVDERRRSSVIPMVKIEQRDERLEELGEEVAKIRDSVLLVQKEAKASQAELLKAFQMHVREPPATRELPPHRDDNQSRGAISRFSQDRLYNGGNTRGSGNCFYCEGEDHISRNCAVKQGHIAKGWLTVEDGVQKLGDGNTLPRGRGSAAVRVEEHYSKRPTSQNWQSSVDVFYSGEAQEESDMDAIWDEMRSLRSQLKQLTGKRSEPQNAYVRNSPPYQGYMAPPVAGQGYGHQGYIGPPVVQPAYMAQAVAPVAMDEQALSTGLARVFLNLLNENKGSLDQFATTRTGKETAAQPGPGF